jgi:acetyl-CoA decarbonylase/synthase complex subunit delta
MTNIYAPPKKDYKTSIREVELNGLTVGGENSFLFMHSETDKPAKPLIICEILTNIPPNYPQMLKDFWGQNIYNPVECVKSALNMGFSALAIKFNIENCEDIDAEIEKSKEQLKEILKLTDLPLFLIGTFRREVDIKLLPELAKTADRKCTIGAVEEENFKQIAPVIKEYGHNIIARTPIDINLTKQLNILLTEMGFDADKIIIDPNTGGLGYGLDYAYSVIERIKQAALLGDTMLNMPIIAFVGEESWKTKEAKSSNVPEEWGNLPTRAISWESITASSMLVSGANMVVMRHPECIKYVQNFLDKTYS